MFRRDKFKIKGASKLKGVLHLDSSKNLTMPAISTSLLFKNKLVIKKITKFSDINNFIKLLKDLGIKIRIKKNELHIETNKIKKTKFKKSLSDNLRGHISLIGSFCLRFKEISFSAPGGCDIGKRGIDMIIDFLKKINLEIINENNSFIKIKGSAVNTDFTFYKKTFTGTINAILTSCLIKGTTILRNCSIEPEIVSIIKYLKEQGVDIKGGETLTINGKEELYESKKPFILEKDRIQAMSFLLLSILKGGNGITIKDAPIDALTPIFDLLKELNQDSFVIKGKDIIIKERKKLSNFIKKEIVIKEHPGIPTDIQNILVIFLSQIGGSYVVKETIFEDRVKKQAEEFKKGGVLLDVVNNKEVIVSYSPKLKYAKYNSIDLRCGFAEIFLSILSGGGEVRNINLIDRGYYKIEEKLKSIGVDIKRSF